MRHQPFTILLHIALIIILVGAFVTHFWGIQGSIILYADASPISCFAKESGPGSGELPFSVSLDQVEIIYYPATVTPMDFRSILIIDDHKIPVAMNKVGEYEGWRFYQSGISYDSSTLSVSYDPWGTGITYTGYLLLTIGMLGFFFQRNTPWRSLLRKYRRGIALTFLILIFTPVVTHANNAPKDIKLPVMQRPLAANFGKILVYWNDRICPLQTLARDVTACLYEEEYYKGYTPEQVLSGWLFYYEEWQRDFLQSNPELKELPPFPVSKKEKKLAEKLAIVEWIGTGEIFRIYPYIKADGHMEWLSLTGRRPSGMSLEQWTFMQNAMPSIKELLLKGKNIQANQELLNIKEGQRKYSAGVLLPSDSKINAERFYNSAVRPAIAAIVALCIGLITLILSIIKTKAQHYLPWISSLTAIILFLYILIAMGMLWWLSGHVPLSNGPETMMFMALVSFAGGCICRNLTLKGGLLIVGAMSLFVTAMGGRTPQIGAMMPVLTSPLLAIHVVVVMISYSLFSLMAILSLVALLSRSEQLRYHFSVINRLMLTPAVCLLGAGIFIGAVWANQTWGRYWGWDPKETCTLVMLLVYALPVHWGSKRLFLFRKPRVLHIYLLLAILTVLFTYFGANYFLSGLHSYA